MAAPPPKRPIEEGQPDWLVTFGDMMTLLMTFFVLLFSMSTLDPVKMADMAAAMEDSLAGSVREQSVKIKTQSEIHKEIQEKIKAMRLEEVAEASHSPKGTTITIDSKFAFDVGRADLRPSLLPLLDSIIPVMSDKGNKFPIAVEGHTDSDPPRGEIAVKYPTNWELSGARAAAVVRYCQSKGVPGGKLRAVGFADRVPYGTSWQDTRLGVSQGIINNKNQTEDLKAKNRRVEITFLSVG